MTNKEKVPQDADVKRGIRHSIEMGVAGACGGMFLGLADIIRNQEAAVVKRFGEVLGPLVSSVTVTDYAILGLLVLACLGYVLCWIYEPHTKTDAFARGLAVVALLNLTPNLSPESSAPHGIVQPNEVEMAVEKATPIEAVVFPTRFLQDRPQPPCPLRPMEARGDTVIVKLRHKGTQNLIEKQALITVRDLDTAHILCRYRAETPLIRLDQPDLAELDDIVRVEVEVPGYRRIKFDLSPEKQYAQAYQVDLTPSIVPMGIQQLFGFKKATLVASVFHP